MIDPDDHPVLYWAVMAAFTLLGLIGGVFGLIYHIRLIRLVF